MAKEETTKIKKKRWYPILAPNIFGEKVIGESLLTESKLLLGKSISCNLMSLTNDVKSQHIYMSFIIREVKENKGFTEAVSYEISPTYIKRFVRRGKERIDDSFAFKTKDGRIMRVKPFLLTNSPASNSVLTKIRKALKQKIAEIITQNTYDDIFDGVVSYKIQKELKSEINKVFPVRTLEIRFLGDEKEKTGTKKKHEDFTMEVKDEAEDKEESEDIEEQEEKTEEELNDVDAQEEIEEEKPRKKSKKKDADETID